jgi:hypothetical protein
MPYLARADGHDRHTPARLAWLTFCASAVLAVALATASVAKERPADIIAAHVRTQGYACETAQSARRDRRASRPNETVWTLTCSNATYRVTLVPDMAARVSQVK